MLPHPYHPPTLRLQLPVHPPVPRLVRSQLRRPERNVAFGLRTMLWAAVPEAAIHKHRSLQLRKGEVGPSGDGVLPARAGDAMRTEQLGERDLPGLGEVVGALGHHACLLRTSSMKPPTFNIRLRCTTV